MPTFWEIIFAPYVAGPVGLLAGVVFNHIKTKYWDIRGIRKILSFLRSETTLYVPLYKRDGYGFGVAAGYGDMLAFADLHVVATKLGFKHYVEVATCTSGSLNQVEKRRNLVVLGGGTANIHHLSLIQELAPPIHFWDDETSDNKTLRNKDGTFQLSPLLNEDGTVVKDVGLIVFGPNPYNTERTILLCAGAYTYGTAAAMRYFLSPEGSSKVRSHFGKVIAIAVICDVQDQNPVNIQLKALELSSKP